MCYLFNLSVYIRPPPLFRAHAIQSEAERPHRILQTRLYRLSDYTFDLNGIERENSFEKLVLIMLKKKNDILHVIISIWSSSKCIFHIVTVRAV